MKSAVRAGNAETHRLSYLTLEREAQTPLPLSRLVFRKRTYLVVGTMAFGSAGEPVVLGVLQD